MQQQLFNEAMADMEQDKLNYSKGGASNSQSRSGVVTNEGPVKGVSSRPASEIHKPAQGSQNATENYIDVAAFRN